MNDESPPPPIRPADHGPDRQARSDVDVFVSYASEDAPFANAIVAVVEGHGLRCWIAPRDVVPGTLYADGIVRAINGSRVFALVLSEHSVASSHVGKEIERASSKGRPIIALRTDAALLSPAFEYFLSESQWIDAAADGTAAAAAAKLVDAVRRHLELPAAHAPPDQSAADYSRQTAAAHPIGRPAAPSRRRWWLAAAMLVVVLPIAYLIADRTLPPKQTAPVAPTAVSDQSIAVLPFADLSEKKDQEYFADGMSEELIDLLTKIQGLRVPARTSSFYYKGKQATIADIAKVLGVAHVLEGSVRKSGKTIRITAQLIRADSGYHVWSETFDRPLNDVFKVQDEIANAVVKALKVSLMGPATPPEVLTTNSDAYGLYLQARALMHSAGEGDFKAAEGALQRAVALDPNFAAAWALLPGALLGDLGWHSDDVQEPELCRRAREAVDRAISIAPMRASGHVSNSEVLGKCDKNLTAAEVEIKRALELEPQNTDAWHRYSWLMVAANRWEDAIRYGQEAASRDPLNAWNHFPVAWAQGYAGQYAQAEATYRKAIALNPTPTPAGLHALHANSLLALNNPAAALAENALESDDQFRQMNLPLIYDALGRKADAEREIAVFERKYAARDPWTMAEFYACRGDAGRAIPWLAGDNTPPDPSGDVVNRLACLKKIEGDPRYQALLAKWKRNSKPTS